MRKVLILFNLFLASCGGSNSSNLTGDSAQADFSDAQGFWALTQISLNGDTVAHVDLSQSIEITSSEFKITDYSQGCSAIVTYALVDGRLTDEAPTVTCESDSDPEAVDCTLTYSFVDANGVIDEQFVMCPYNFPVTVDATLTAQLIDSTTAEIEATYQTGDELTLRYRKLIGHSTSGVCSGLNFETNGPNPENDTSYLDCDDADGSYQIGLYDDFTGMLVNANGTFSIFYWLDSSSCLLDVFVYDEVGTRQYYYVDSLELDGDGFISSGRMYKEAGTGGSNAMSFASSSSNGESFTCAKVDN